MIGAIVRAALVAVIATVTLVGVVQLAPTQRPFAVAVYLLVMGGLTVHVLVGWLRLTYPPPPASPFDTALAARPVPLRPPGTPGSARVASRWPPRPRRPGVGARPTWRASR